MDNIGIIGQGFVGTAIKEGMQHALKNCVRKQRLYSFACRHR